MKGACRALWLAAIILCLAGCGGAEPVVLVTSWSMRAPGTATPARVTLPTHVDGVLPRAPCRYSLRASVPVPPEMRDRPLTLAIPRLDARATLSADGVEAAPLDARDDDEYRDPVPPRWRIAPTSRAAIDLELTIDHTWTQSGWLDTVPRLSATRAGDATFRRLRSFNRVTAIAALAFTVLIAFTYGLIFFSDRRRVGSGWLALEVLAAAMYPAFQLGITAPLFGPSELAILTWSLALAAVSSVHFSHAQFGVKPPGRAGLVVLVVAAAVAVVARGPFVATRALVPIAIASQLFAVGYQVFFFRARTGAPLDAFLVRVTWGLLALLGSVDFVAWAGFGEPLGGLRGACLGIAIVALLQSVVLTREHIMFMERADSLNVELGTRVALLESSNREIEALNEELRHQIAARSEELAEKLAAMPDLETQTFTGAPGTVVGDRYTIVRSLGTGAMGTVYEVRRLRDERRFAMKVLKGTPHGRELARFAREAQMVSALDHPNVVSIVDVDFARSGLLYVVMELVEGTSLGERRARFGDAAWAIDVLAQVAAGLEAVHAKGIVHRDLKPANVLLDDGAKPRAKIVDFGVSTIIADVSEDWMGFAQTLEAQRLSRSPGRADLTRTGAILGTPFYIAPEVASGRSAASTASDVFSFGVMAFELLTGRVPFDEAAVLARFQGRTSAPERTFGSAAPTLETLVAALLDRCLADDRLTRPTAREIAERLARPAA